MTNQAGLYRQVQEVADTLLSQGSETPLSKAIKNLCLIRLNDPLRLVVPAHKERLLMMQTNWTIGLLWVFQKQSKEIRRTTSPFNHPHFEYREPFGTWLNAELNLWDSCFDFADASGKRDIISHQSVVQAWSETVLERIVSDWQHSMINQQKRHHLTSLSEEIKLLRAGTNPFEENLPEQSERFNLISLVLAIATPAKTDNNKLRQKRKHFRDFIWKAYLASRSKWAERFATEGFKSTLLSDRKLELVLGGRQKRTLYPSPEKSFLKQSKIDKTLKTGSMQGFQEFVQEMGGNEISHL